MGCRVLEVLVATGMGSGVLLGFLIMPSWVSDSLRTGFRLVHWVSDSPLTGFRLGRRAGFRLAWGFRLAVSDSGKRFPTRPLVSDSIFRLGPYP